MWYQIEFMQEKQSRGKGEPLNKIFASDAWAEMSLRELKWA